MPIQAPQWTDYLTCPVCCREFGLSPRSPISLGCGHTLCKQCLKNLHRKQCPFDQTVIQSEPEELVVNTALLQLAGYRPSAEIHHPPCIQALPEQERQAYDDIVRCMEHLAIYLKLCSSANNSMTGNRLSRPMQRKLVTLLQCAMTDEEGRGRAARAARSLGERTVTELILQHQNPQQLSANLWAAVRARGCQFLGPAMQEEVLKLVLLALEDGSALSRKVLVMFVVQRLEPHFPQASKTSIGHVVQLLYRASCFKVSKRECDSSLMQLKEEFRTYDSLRREHDAQIVQIATEAGLRIAPDQWSALLYGDTTHKSHMQSIIDKLQTPQSFAQSVQELFIALQRTGDPMQVVVMSMHLDRLANIDASPDAKSPTWSQLSEIITSIKEVISGLLHYFQHMTGRDLNYNARHNVIDNRFLEQSTGQSVNQTNAIPPVPLSNKMPMCRDSATRICCPRSSACSFIHFDEELDRINSIQSNQIPNGKSFGHTTQKQNMLVPRQVQQQMQQGVPRQVSRSVPQQIMQPIPLPPPPHMYQQYPVPTLTTVHSNQHSLGIIDNYNIASMPVPNIPQNGPPPMLQSPSENLRNDCIAYASYAPINPVQMGMINPYYPGFTPNNVGNRYHPAAPDLYPGPGVKSSIGYKKLELPATPQNPNNIFVPIQHVEPSSVSPYSFEDVQTETVPEFQVKPFSSGCQANEGQLELTWSPNNNVFNFGGITNAIDAITAVDGMFANPPVTLSSVISMASTVGDNMTAASRSAAELAFRADDQELEQELKALERRIGAELKSAE